MWRMDAKRPVQCLVIRLNFTEDFIMKVGTLVKIICTPFKGSVGTITRIVDEGDYQNIDVDFTEPNGVKNSDIFHDGELIEISTY